MPLASIMLLMLVLPIGSIVIEHAYFTKTVPVILLVGKWFVFWSAGVRLTFAGLRQILQPQLVSEQIFGIKSDIPLPFARELGVANFATGVVGLISLVRPSFTLPVATAAAIFYGLAGIRHVAEGGRTRNERIAMAADLFAFPVFATYVAVVAVG